MADHPPPDAAAREADREECTALLDTIGRAVYATPPDPAARVYARKPFDGDLLAASWPADPLNDAEEAAYTAAADAAGFPPISRAGRERWPAFNAMIRQSLAAAAAADPTPGSDA